MATPAALVYLAYRALLAHPLRRLRLVGSGLDRFRRAYVSEGLVPTSAPDRALAEAAAACIGCGLCEPGCELAGVSGPARALGLHAAFRLYGRSSAELPLAAEALAACEDCTGCDARCPTGVPISRIVKSLQERAAAAGSGRAPARGAPAPAPPLVSSGA